MKKQKTLAEKVEESLSELSAIANQIYKEVEEYVKSLPSPIPGASEKVLAPVFAYCLRAPIELGRAYDIETYKFEVKKCLTSYMNRVMSVYQEVVEKSLGEEEEGEEE